MDSILIPMAVHILWCTLLYAMLTVARAPVVWEVGIKADGSNPFEKIQLKISANLSNQFEWPLFFHVLCTLLITTGSELSSAMLLLAWVFIFGRVLHSLVQIFGTSVKARGIVFTINFIAVLAMWGLFLIDTLPLL